MLWVWYECVLQINSTQLLIKTRLAFQSDECSTDATLESATHILQLITRKGDELKQETVISKYIL